MKGIIGIDAGEDVKQRPRLYLIDGSGYIFRAYFAIRPLSTRAGLPTNAVIGFARMLAKLLRDEQPHLLGIAFDTPAKTFRHELYSSYKANRDEPPEDLVPQFGLIHELVAAMAIPVLKCAGFEADDIIATLVQHARAHHDVTVVSGDKDLMQLVGPHVTMLDPMKDKRYDADAVIERFGVPPGLVADVQALAGDSSDNIPGVPKVGAKSAAKLVAQYGGVEEVYTAIAALAAKGTKLKAFEQSLLDHIESARLSKQLTTLAVDAPVSLDTTALTYAAPNRESLAAFLRRIEAYALLRDFGLVDARALGAVAPAPSALASPTANVEDVGAPAATAPGTPAPGTIDRSTIDRSTTAPSTIDRSTIDPGTIDRSTYRTITTMDQLDDLMQQARTVRRLSVDLETTALDPNQADIVGIAWCVPGYAAAYIPVAHHYLGAPKQLDRAAVLDKLRPLLQDDAIAKVGQNLKYDLLVFMRAGVELRGIADDSMLAAYVLDPSRPSFGLDALARDELGHRNIAYSDVTGHGKSQIGFDAVPVDQATAYAAEDADVALRLCDLFAQRLRDEKSRELDRLYRDLELPLLPVLAAMERRGIRVDGAALGRLSREFNERLAQIEARAHAMIGRPINLASPKQLAHLFFEELDYPVIKKTKTGYSTDQEVLETLAQTYELPGVILQHRLLSKLQSTYVDALPRMVNPHTGRVHTSFNQTGAATGRLSSSDPNLQNIPIRTDDGRRIRDAFVTDAGCVLVSADYSQIELRVLAHLCADTSFVEAFVRGEDIHRRTAMEILTGGAEPTSEMRRRAKTINFGIIYGQSEFGLSRQLGISRTQARDYIASYFARYPRIRQFFDATFEAARNRGYVTTLLGRRRYLPELSSRNGAVRRGAERVAMNTPIQGSAADLIKLAMINLDARLRKSRSAARLLLQVHDELVLEVPAAELDAVVAMVREEMTGVMRLAVPLVVDIGHGASWGQAH